MAECFLLGVILMLIYDILKIVRIIIKHSGLLIAIQDIIYWVISGGLMFLLLYKEDAGSIRWFAVGMVLLGMLLYYLMISRFFIPLIEKGIKIYSKKVQGLLQKIYKKDKIE